VARYPTGDVYEGAFRGGTREGFGIMRFADGSSYEGYWLDGEPVSEAIYRAAAEEADPEVPFEDAPAGPPAGAPDEGAAASGPPDES
jgi:hypothetical protein